MIIDAHCHAGRGDGLRGPWDTSAPLDAYLRRAEAAGITRTVLIPVFHSDYRMVNRQVAGLASRHPLRFLPAAAVHAVRDRGRVEKMLRTMAPGVHARAVKVHRHDARISREICAVARVLGLPVIYDVMGEVAPLDLIAREYPTVSFIVPHLGSFGDDWRAHLALIDVLVRHRNVFADTSGVRRFDVLLEAVRRAGARKLIFGSDGPWLHPGLELTKVRLLGLAPEDERAVLGDNMGRLLGLSPSGSRPGVRRTMEDGRRTATEA